MVKSVQHVDMNGSIQGNENTTMLSFRGLYTEQNMPMNIILYLC